MNIKELNEIDKQMVENSEFSCIFLRQDEN